ncbi:hypothetical protein HDU86_003391 [Geranomyces michiganensis]|nr:hypothetical protein HDU86_003391 [Geranomyces michiganensis]
MSSANAARKPSALSPGDYLAEYPGASWDSYLKHLEDIEDELEELKGARGFVHFQESGLLGALVNAHQTGFDAQSEGWKSQQGLIKIISTKRKTFAPEPKLAKRSKVAGLLESAVPLGPVGTDGEIEEVERAEVPSEDEDDNTEEVDGGQASKRNTDGEIEEAERAEVPSEDEDDNTEEVDGGQASKRNTDGEIEDAERAEVPSEDEDDTEEVDEVAIEHSEEGNNEGDPHRNPKRILLSTTVLRQKFESIRTFVSKADFIFGKANISAWVRSAQSHLMKECLKGNVPKFKPEAVADILLMHDILIISPTYRPGFIAIANRPNITRLWSELVATAREERITAKFPDTVRDAVNIFCDSYRATANFTKAWKLAMVFAFESSGENDEKDEGMGWKVLEIVRSFWDAIQKNARHRRFLSTRKEQDEDTHVHAILHTMMEEVFNNEHIITVWANGESRSSRAHRAAYHTKGHGKKPDGRVISESFEELFIETKAYSVSDGSPSAMYDLYKVAIFLQGLVNAKTKLGVSGAKAYGFHLLSTAGETLEVYMMILEFDGLYTLHHLASCKLFRRADDLDLLMKLIAVLLNIKEKILENVRKAAGYDSDDWDLHLSSPLQSPEERPSVDFMRESLPTPLKKKSTIPPFL